MRKTYDRKAMKPVMPPTDAEDIEWRDVVGFEGRYEVSNYGHVRTIRARTCCGKATCK